MVRWSEQQLEHFKKGRSTPAKRQGRIKATKTERNGIVFDSKREADRYDELQLMERAGAISGLRLQVPFALVVNRMHVCTYVADFVFTRDGKEVVCDAKGHRTEVYRLKKKLMRAVYGITIEEL